MNSTNKRNRSLLFIPALAMLALLALAATQQPILRLLLQQDADGGGNSFTNLANIVASNANLQIITGPATNQFVAPAGSFLNSSNYVNKIGTQIFAINGTNVWWDFGLTNDSGPIVYQTLIATNNVNFLGPTNVNVWDLLSMNVIASGADRMLSIPTNLPHLTTNGLLIGGSSFRLVLTNGNEFRITLQSNITLSTIWTTFGQGMNFPTNGLAPPTNSPVNGYVVTASGAQSKWAPALNVTNNPVAGYSVFASSGSTALWAAPASGGGSNSVLQSLFRFDNTVIDYAAKPLIFWGSANDAIQKFIGAGGTLTFDATVIPSASWVSSSPAQIETHRYIIIGDGLNIPLIWSSNWVFVTEGSGPAPVNLASNQIYVLTITHIGGETNWLVTYKTATNALAGGF